MLPLILTAVFAGTFLAVVTAVLATRPMVEAPARKQAAAGADDPDNPRPVDWTPDLDSNLLRDESLSAIGFWSGLLERIDGVEIMKRHIAESGLRWTVGRTVAMMLLAAASCWAFLSTFTFIPRYITFAVGLAAGAAPYLIIMRRRRQRLQKLEEQFPEALESLARSLRAGNPIGAGLEMLARECKAPLAQEMRKTADERALGLSLDQAMDNLAARVPVPEIHLFVAAVQLQSRTGGRLHEVLSRLAETMRESYALKSEIRSIAAHGRMTGALLTFLPVGIAAMMMWVNPAHMLVLWTHPAGKDLIFAAICCLILAHVIIRKLVDIRI
ncbi:MAG: type II secretion system F family protein [Acidobacteriota bacterium]